MFSLVGLWPNRRFTTRATRIHRFQRMAVRRRPIASLSRKLSASNAETIIAPAVGGHPSDAQKPMPAMDILDGKVGIAGYGRAGPAKHHECLRSGLGGPNADIIEVGSIEAAPIKSRFEGAA